MFRGVKNRLDLLAEEAGVAQGAAIVVNVTRSSTGGGAARVDIKGWENSNSSARGNFHPGVGDEIPARRCFLSSFPRSRRSFPAIRAARVTLPSAFRMR